MSLDETPRLSKLPILIHMQRETGSFFHREQPGRQATLASTRHSDKGEYSDDWSLDFLVLLEGERAPFAKKTGSRGPGTIVTEIIPQLGQPCGNLQCTNALHKKKCSEGSIPLALYQLEQQPGTNETHVVGAQPSLEQAQKRVTEGHRKELCRAVKKKTAATSAWGSRNHYTGSLCILGWREAIGESSTYLIELGHMDCFGLRNACRLATAWKIYRDGDK